MNEEPWLIRTAFGKKKSSQNSHRRNGKPYVTGAESAVCIRSKILTPAKFFYTNVACRLLDLKTCRCQDYANRSRLVPDCLQLTADLAKELSWLPESCAYRRLAEGRPLAWWHPLNSGDPETVRQVGVSVCGKAVAEAEVDLGDLEDMVVDWFD